MERTFKSRNIVACLSELCVFNNCAVAAEVLLESLQNLFVVNAFLKTLQTNSKKGC